MSQTDFRQAENTSRWLKISGPLYSDIECVVRAHFPDHMEINIDGDTWVLSAHAVSISSWILLRAAAKGDRVTIKTRVDDAALRRLEK